MTTALFMKILVGSDGSSSAAQAIARAATLAEAAGGSLVILGVCGGEGDRAALLEKLQASADELAASGLPVQARVEVGDASDVLLEVATEMGADLIVLGNKGMTGARRFILGSVPDKVSHKATCSVMIARTV